MIYVIMHGRLGNQMFQYAFARRLEKRRHDGISLYFGRVEKNGWTNDLTQFNTEKYRIESNTGFLFSRMSFKQKILLGDYLIHCRNCKRDDDLMNFQVSQQKKLNQAGLYWIRNGEFRPIDSYEKNIFVCGHFEYYKLYKGLEDELHIEFSSSKPLMDSNKEMMHAITETESVCVSIRRGDYLSDQYKSEYYICDEDYFDKAISKAKELIDNPFFFFFSDDVNWIKKKYGYLENSYFESSGNPVWEKIRLMSSCKHFIISNSTFSWWCQYLGQNKEKVVISPSIWKRGSSYKGLISPKFHLIETK